MTLYDRQVANDRRDAGGDSLRLPKTAPMVAMAIDPKPVPQVSTTPMVAMTMDPKPVS